MSNPQAAGFPAPIRQADANPPPTLKVQTKPWEEVKNALESLKTQASELGHAAVDLVPARKMRRLCSEMEDFVSPATEVLKNAAFDLKWNAKFTWIDIKYSKFGRTASSAFEAATKKLDSVWKIVYGKAQEGFESAQEGLKRGKEGLEEAYDSAKEGLESAYDSVKEKMTPKPAAEEKKIKPLVEQTPEPASAPRTEPLADAGLAPVAQQSRESPVVSTRSLTTPPQELRPAAASASANPRSLGDLIKEESMSRASERQQIKETKPSSEKAVRAETQGPPDPYVTSPARLQRLNTASTTSRDNVDLHAPDTLMNTAMGRLENLPAALPEEPKVDRALIKNGKSLVGKLEELVHKLDKALQQKEKKSTDNTINSLRLDISNVVHSESYKQLKRASSSNEELAGLQERLSILEQMPQQLIKATQLELQAAEDMKKIVLFREPVDKATLDYNLAVAALKKFNEKNFEGGDLAERQRLQSQLALCRQDLIAKRAEIQKIIDKYQPGPEISQDAIIERYDRMRMSLEAYMPSAPEGIVASKTGVVQPSPILQDLLWSGVKKYAVMTEPIRTEFTFLEEVAQRKNFYLKALNKPEFTPEEKLIIQDLINLCKNIEEKLNSNLSEFNIKLEKIHAEQTSPEIKAAKTDQLIIDFYSDERMIDLNALQERGGDLQWLFDRMPSLESKLASIIGKNDASIGKHKPALFIQRLLRYPILLKPCLEENISSPAKEKLNATYKKMAGISSGLNEKTRNKEKAKSNIRHQLDLLQKSLLTANPQEGEIIYINRAFEQLRTGLVVFHANVKQKKEQIPLLKAALEGKITDKLAKRYNNDKEETARAIEGEIRKIGTGTYDPLDIKIRQAILKQATLSDAEIAALKERIAELENVEEKLPVDETQVNKAFSDVLKLRKM